MANRKVHPSVERLNQKLEPNSGNDADYNRDHITSGPEKNPGPATLYPKEGYLSGAKPKSGEYSDE